MSDAEAFSRFTPLLVAELEALERTDSPYHDTVQTLSEFLQSATSILESNAFPSVQVNGHNFVERAQELLERFNVQALSERADAGDTRQLARACYCTLVVLQNLIVHKTPHRHRSNEQYTDWLFATIQSVEDKVWKDVPYLQLLM